MHRCGPVTMFLKLVQVWHHLTPAVVANKVRCKLFILIVQCYYSSMPSFMRTTSLVLFFHVYFSYTHRYIHISLTLCTPSSTMVALLGQAVLLLLLD